MAGRIPESFIDELMNRVDIVEVIESRLPLKRAGSEYKACCPFHEEKTPSFTVSPRKQFYHCFGCGAHGTALGFLINYEGLEFVDAVEVLAQQLGLEVPREVQQTRKVDLGVYEVLDTAARYFENQLKQSQEAISYLKTRGLSGEIAKTYGMGYAPQAWHGLIDHLGGRANEKAIKAAGLVSEGEKGWYDKFRHRIMFPIHDRRGRAIAFGGRAMDDKGPKYLNSPETQLFHKGRELYGLHLARKRSQGLQRLIVVEGYMDVVALAQFGISETVATLGTATTPQQAELMFRNTAEVIFCFDGDRAGRKAAWRALESTLPALREGREARFLFLPEGEDPDSMIRKEGTEAFEQRLNGAQALSSFFFGHLEAQTHMDSVEGRARFVDLAKPYIAGLKPGVLRDMLLAELSRRAGHPVDSRTLGLTDTVEAEAPAAGEKTPVRLALSYLIQEPKSIEWLRDDFDLEESQRPGDKILAELVDFLRKKTNISTGQLLEHWRSHPAGPHLQKLATTQLPSDTAIQRQEFEDATDRVELHWLKEQLTRLPGRIVEQSEDQKGLYRELTKKIEALKARLQG